MFINNIVALGMSMGVEEIVDEETELEVATSLFIFSLDPVPRTTARLPHAYVNATGGLDTPVWLSISQLSTQKIPSSWFFVPF